MEISGLQRETVDASEIIMSIKCGASDTTSGLASNAVIGYVADKLVDLGGTVEDVFVYHKVYGVLRAEMNIKSRMDIRNYMEEIVPGNPVC